MTRDLSAGLCVGQPDFTDRDYRDQLPVCLACPVREDCLQVGIEGAEGASVTYGGMQGHVIVRHARALRAGKKPHLPKPPRIQPVESTFGRGPGLPAEPYAKRIDALIDAGWTRQYIAASAGVAVSTISRLSRRAHPIVQERVAHKLDRALTDLENRKAAA